MYNKFSDNMRYRPTKEERVRLTDYFMIERQRFYLVPKFGMSIYCSRAISLEIYTGLGIQYRIKEVKDLEFDENLGHKDESGYFFFGPKYDEKEGVTAKFSIGFSLNYKIINGLSERE